MTLTNIMADIRYKATGDSSSTAFSDTDIKRSINNYLHQINEMAIKAGVLSMAFGEILKIDTEASQNEYLLTDTDVNLRKTNFVFVRSSATTNYLESKPITVGEIPDPEDFEPGTPRHYFLEDSIFVYYGTIADVDDGIIIYGQTDISEVSDGDDIPQIPEFAVQYAVLGSVADFKEANNMYNEAGVIRGQMNVLEARITNSYKENPNIKPVVSRAEKIYK
jgi:hypothetical protein